jgi:AcrR family transcriptional regulator
MPSSIAPSTTERRTQAQRRSATRTAILEAAVSCLVEHGYAGTTTRRIAETAGVSAGALKHHFDSKAELLGETRRMLTERAGEELLRQLPSDAPTIRVRTERLLDATWELYKGPLLQAALELLMAARSDPKLRATGDAATAATKAWNEAGATAMFPEFSGQPGLVDLIETVQATLRGLVMMTYGNDRDLDEVWPPVRAHLLALQAEFAGNRWLEPVGTIKSPGEEVGDVGGQR